MQHRLLSIEPWISDYELVILLQWVDQALIDVIVLKGSGIHQLALYVWSLQITVTVLEVPSTPLMERFMEYQLGVDSNIPVHT